MQERTSGLYEKYRVQVLVDSLEDKVRTANQCLVVIRACFRQANAWELTDRNPEASIDRKPERA